MSDAHDTVRQIEAISVAVVRRELRAALAELCAAVERQDTELAELRAALAGGDGKVRGLVDRSRSVVTDVSKDRLTVLPYLAGNSTSCDLAVAVVRKACGDVDPEGLRGRDKKAFERWKAGTSKQPRPATIERVARSASNSDPNRLPAALHLLRSGVTESAR